MSISKQGIVTSSGKVNPNLLCGSHITLTQTTDGSSYLTYTVPDLSQIVNGAKLVISVDIEVYNVASMSRIGAEPSFYTSGGTQWIGVWTSDITNRKQRIFSTYTMSGDATGLGQNGIYIQGITFNTGGYIKLSNPKLEVSTVPTPWVPNVNDDIYDADLGGFFETSNPISANTSIAKNYITANQFYEL